MNTLQVSLNFELFRKWSASPSATNTTAPATVQAILTPPIVTPAPESPTIDISNQTAEVTDGEWTYDPNEPRYCLCNQVSYGDMVACDNVDVSGKVYLIGVYIFYIVLFSALQNGFTIRVSVLLHHLKENGIVHNVLPLCVVAVEGRIKNKTVFKSYFLKSSTCKTFQFSVAVE